MLLALLQVQDFYQGAVSAFKEGRFQDTLSLLEKLPPAEAVRPAPFNLRAMALAELGRYDEALVANGRARELDPINPNYAYNTGLIYLEKGDLQGAARTFSDALQQFPRSARLHRALSEVMMNLLQLEEAERLLTKAAELEPPSSDLYALFARLYYSMGDKEKLAGTASKAIELDPNNHLACFYYGLWLSVYQSDPERGANYIRRSIELQPRFVPGLKEWARFLTHQGKWEEAARIYEKAISVNSQDRQLSFLLSVAYRKIGQKEKAEWALSQFRKLAEAESPKPGRGRGFGATTTRD